MRKLLLIPLLFLVLHATASGPGNGENTKPESTGSLSAAEKTRAVRINQAISGHLRNKQAVIRLDKIGNP